MYIIICGEFFNWKVIGYVETEKEAMDICATHNAEFYTQWYFKEAKHIDETSLLQEGFYEYDVVFNPNKEFLRISQWSIFPTIKKEPKIVQEGQYCYVVRVTTIGEEKAMKIAKDFLMQTLAERAGIC